MYYYNIYRVDSKLLAEHYIHTWTFTSLEEAISKGKHYDSDNCIYIRTIEIDINANYINDTDKFFMHFFPSNKHIENCNINYSPHGLL